MCGKIRWEGTPNACKTCDFVSGKEYSGEHDLLRKKVYMTNSQRIAQHNKLYAQGLVSFQMEMNHFGDIAPHEFRKMMNGFQRNYNETKSKSHPVFLTPSFTDIPAEVDWRTKGYVTPVKNQVRNLLARCGI